VLVLCWAGQNVTQVEGGKRVKGFGWDVLEMSVWIRGGEIQFESGSDAAC
jgi:hypothetical protein